MTHSFWFQWLRSWIMSAAGRPRTLRRARSVGVWTSDIPPLDPRVLLSASPIDAASTSLWSPVASLANARGVNELHLTDFTALSLNEAEMRQTLDAAPNESLDVATQTNTLTLVNPDGHPQRFAIYETAVMAPELAAQFPEIKTYAGRDIDDPTATVHFDLTPQGFHAQVLSTHGRWYIDPYVRLQTDVYASYYARDVVSSAAQRGALGDIAESDLEEIDHPADTSSGRMPSEAGNVAHRSGTQLRTYRAAVAATGEYTAFPWWYGQRRPGGNRHSHESRQRHL